MDSNDTPVVAGGDPLPPVAPLPPLEKEFADEGDLTTPQARKTQDVYLEQFHKWVTVGDLTYGDQEEAERLASRRSAPGQPLDVDKHEQNRQTILRAMVRPKMGPVQSAALRKWWPATIIKVMHVAMKLSGLEVDPAAAARTVLDPELFSKPQSEA